MHVIFRLFHVYCAMDYEFLAIFEVSFIRNIAECICWYWKEELILLMLVEFDKLFWVGTVEVIAGTSLFRICKVNSEQNLAILSQTISSKLFKKQTVIKAIQRCREIINIIPWIASQSLNFHHFCTKANSFVNHSLVEGIFVFWENCIKAWRYLSHLQSSDTFISSENILTGWLFFYDWLVFLICKW